MHTISFSTPKSSDSHSVDREPQNSKNACRSTAEAIHNHYRAQILSRKREIAYCSELIEPLNHRIETQDSIVSMVELRVMDDEDVTEEIARFFLLFDPPDDESSRMTISQRIFKLCMLVWEKDDSKLKQMVLELKSQDAKIQKFISLLAFCICLGGQKISKAILLRTLCNDLNFNTPFMGPKLWPSDNNLYEVSMIDTGTTHQTLFGHFHHFFVDHLKTVEPVARVASAQVRAILQQINNFFQSEQNPSMPVAPKWSQCIQEWLITEGAMPDREVDLNLFQPKIRKLVAERREVARLVRLSIVDHYFKEKMPENYVRRPPAEELLQIIVDYVAWNALYEMGSNCV